MITKEQALQLKPNQEIYYKTLYTFPECLIVKELSLTDDNCNILLEDGTYIPEHSFEQVFLTKEECVDVCKKELNMKLEKLRYMLETEK